MKIIAATRTTVMSMSYALPVLLAVNTFALVAANQLGGIPEWIKSAVALFLAF